MPARRPNEPLTSPRFKVDFPKLRGVFSEVTATASEFEVISYKFADANGAPGFYALPGAMKPPEITLKRGITPEDASAWDWFLQVQHGQLDNARCHGTIYLCDYDGSTLIEFAVEQAWPKKVSMPSPKAGSNEVLVEEITLVCEEFHRQK